MDRAHPVMLWLNRENNEILNIKPMHLIENTSRVLLKFYYFVYLIHCLKYYISVWI
jgi:hypothetical protein